MKNMKDGVEEMERKKKEVTKESEDKEEGKEREQEE